MGAVNVDFLRRRPDGAFDVEAGDDSGGFQAVLEDFNGDGYPDLALDQFGKLVVRLGNAGGFAPPVEVGRVDGPPAAYDFDLAAGDFDGDGRVDLVGVSKPSSTVPRDLAVRVFQGDGYGSFTPRDLSYPLQSTNLAFPLYLASVLAEDLDGDGRTDLVLLTYANSYSDIEAGPTILLRNAGDGTFSFSGLWQAPYQNQLVSAAVSSRSGEPLPDLIATTTTSDGCTLISIPGGEAFLLQTIVHRSLLGPAPCDRTSLVVADYNGDGWPDVATVQQGDLVVVLGDGRGGFTSQTRLRSGSFTLLAPMKGDGSHPASLVTMIDSRGPGLGIFSVITDVVPLRNLCDGPGSGLTRVLPWVGASPGLSGAFFESDLTLTNSGSTQASLELQYTATTGEGSGTVPHTLHPGEQLVARSALGFLRSKGLNIPETGSQGGTLRVLFSGLSSPDAGAVGSRTASEGAGVWYPGSAPQGLPVLIGPLKEDASDRTNLVLSHTGGPEASDAVMRVVVTSTDPSSPGAVALPDVHLKPGETRQIGRILSASGLNATSGFAFVSLDGTAAPFWVHAIVNDNVTSDGSYVPPAKTSDWPYRPATRTLVIPAIAEAGEYSTELFLVNASDFDQRLRLEIPNAPDESGVRSLAVLLVDLPFRSARFFSDFFDELRKQGLAPERGGTLLHHVLVRREDDGPLDGILAGARVKNPAPGGGFYGVYLPAVDLEELPETSVQVPGLKQDGASRTNLAITNIGDEAGSEGVFRIDLFDGDLGTKVISIYDVHIAAGGFRQLNSILAAFGPGTKQGYCRVARTSGSGPFVAYAVINDGARPGDGTGDGSFVLGRP